ncbi:MAG: sensor histidine kinase [Blautia sp.]
MKEPADELEYLGASLQVLAGQAGKGGENQRKFISNISHDFRSPLTSIKGYVEAILDGTIPVEMQDRYLNIVLSETERLEKLTKALLTLNTFDDNGYLMEMSDFDINEVIRKSLETFEGRCNARGIRFSLLFDEPCLPVHADMEKIQQVLYNLIDNAIKFSPDRFRHLHGNPAEA